MTTPASHGPSGGGLTPPPAFDDGDTFDDLGVDGDAYLASLLDKAGGDLAAQSRAALEDPDALAALVAKREAEESTAAEVDALKASIAEKARRVLDDPSSPARVHNKTGVLGRELTDGLATSLADDARALEIPTASPMSEARKAAERERLAAALARRRDASAKYGRVDPADKRRWPSKSENERRLRELEDARKSYERRYPPAKIDAGGGLLLPARVDAQPGPPKAKENRAPTSKTTTAVRKPRPWRHNALASYDKNDQISVTFDDTRRVKTLATNRRVHGTKPTRKNDAAHKDGWRVDREKYPSFKNWLSERKTDLVDEKRKNEELAAKMRERAEREKEIRARVRGQKAMAGDGSDPAPSAAVDVPAPSVDDNPALANFLAMCDEFANGEDGLEEFVSDPAWRAAATKAIEAKAVEAAKAAAKAAVAAKERMIEDRLMTQKIVAEEERMDEEALRVQTFANPPSAPEPRGPVETVMDGDVVLKKADVADVHDDDDDDDEKNAEEIEEAPEEAPPDPAIVSKEQLIANALAAMSADERTAARAAACKGWTADFSGTFFKGTGTVSKPSPHPSKTPTWCEKPRKNPNENPNDLDAKLDVADLAVEFIGPNAADLAYAALHPNSEAPVAPKATDSPAKRRWEIVTTADEAVARGLVAKPGEPGFDMAKVKEVLECQFMGPAGDYMALQAVFPGAKDPTAPAPRDKYMKKKKVVEGKALKMHAERIKEGEFALQTGVPQLAVEFIGANAQELTAEAIAGYLNPATQPATENVVGDPDKLDETMDEEEYAEFIAADPVQGAVDLPNPRPPLLLADLFAAEEEAARMEEAGGEDDAAGECDDDEVQADFEEFAAEAEEIKTSRRNSENVGGDPSMTSPADPPAVLAAAADDSSGDRSSDDRSPDDQPAMTDDAIEDALAKYSISMDSSTYSPIKENDGTLDAVRRLVNEGSADALQPTTDGQMDTGALKAAADAMARGDVVPPEAISDAARAMGVPGFGADWRETGRAAETAAAGGDGGDVNPWSGGGEGEGGGAAPSAEEVLREGEAVASKVDAAVAGGDVPDRDDARALLDGVKDRVGVAFNK